MAWIFSLSAECGAEESSVNRFAQHFEKRKWLLSSRVNRFPQHFERRKWLRSSDRQCLFRTETFQDLEQNWWCRVCLNSMSQVGIDSPENAYVMTEIGILLYQALKSAPSFRYALVGVEVDEFRTYSELLEDLPTLSIPGLVIAKQLDPSLETLPTFRPFTADYVWQPYAGEIYNPLMTSPELKNKLNQLLAVT